MSRFKVCERVRVWKPGHYEHGMQAVVGQIITIEEYYGDDYNLGTFAKDRGPHAYRPQDGWRDEYGEWFCGGPLPDAMVVSEHFYQQWLDEHNLKWRYRH